MKEVRGKMLDVFSQENEPISLKSIAKSKNLKTIFKTHLIHC